MSDKKVNIGKQGAKSVSRERGNAKKWLSNMDSLKMNYYDDECGWTSKELRL
jgi:hypothetical protein